MSLATYLSEDGTGTFARYFVADLLPPREHANNLELLFVFESPHNDEVRAGLPVVGATGQAVLTKLMSANPHRMPLGRWVNERHVQGDFRVGVANVSNVPLQRIADNPPQFGTSEWAALEYLRKARSNPSLARIRSAERRAAAHLLVSRMENRATTMSTAQPPTAVLAGACAQWFWNAAAASLPHAFPTIEVPHPGRGHWARSSAKATFDHLAALFSAASH